MTEIKFTPLTGGVKLSIDGAAVSHVVSALVKFSSESKVSDNSTEYGEEGVSSVFGVKGTCEIIRSKLFSFPVDSSEGLSEITIENDSYRYILSGCALIYQETSAVLQEEREKFIYSVSQGRKVKK